MGQGTHCTDLPSSKSERRYTSCTGITNSAQINTVALQARAHSRQRRTGAYMYTTNHMSGVSGTDSTA